MINSTRPDMYAPNNLFIFVEFCLILYYLYFTLSAAAPGGERVLEQIKTGAGEDAEYFS